jgi:hypothetical protein
VEQLRVLAEPEAAVYEEWLLERLFDETMALEIKQKLLSHHTTLNGTLMQVNTSPKSFVPIEVFLKPEAYTQRIRLLDQTRDQASRNHTITFRDKRHSNQTHVSTTDPDATLANKENGTAAMAGDSVNGLMENRHRLLLRINIESFRGPASEMEGPCDLLDTFHEKHALRVQTVGTDKGYFAKPFLTALFRRRIQPHIAAKTTGREVVHQRVRRMNQTAGYHLSQRVRKKIEELWGEAKCWHSFRRFQ